MEPPKSNIGAAAVSIGLIAAAGALGGTLAGVAAKKRPAPEHRELVAGGASLGILGVGIGGVATAAMSKPWRRLGLWTAGLGLGSLMVALSLVETKVAYAAVPNPSQLPPGPGQEGVAASITLVPGAQQITVPTGSRLTLLAPTGGELTSVAAPSNGMPKTTVTGPWIVMNVPGPGEIDLTWTDAQGQLQSSAVTVVESAQP